MTETGEWDDLVEDLLAAADEALAAGDLPDTVSFTGAAPDTLRLDREIAFLHQVRQTLRRPGPPDAGGGPGTTLGRFQVLHELGRGSFGVVFLAHDPLLRREVALKVPRAEMLVTPELRARFHREARAAAGLDHPNVVPVYEAGEVGPVVFLVSAYCPGLTLAQWLRRRAEPVPARQAALLVAHAADGVQHAHERGVIHRDLKPSNILLAPGDRPMIADFGLAKLASDGATDAPTRSGVVVGTISYMAPEQAAGQAARVGPAADVYALGAILYELLTGRPPFRGESDLDTLQQVQRDEPVPPSRLRPRLPRDLQTVCLTCLEKDPARRYPTAGAAADDLRRFLDHRPIQARPVGPWGKLWRWARRRPAVAGLLLTAAVALLALAGVAIGAYTNARLAGALAETERAKVAAEGAHRAEAGARRQAETYKYFLHIALAHSGWRDGNPHLMNTLLDDCPPDERQWEWHYLKRRGHTDVLALAGHTGPVVGAAFLPDGARLASAGNDKTVRLWDRTTGQVLHTFEGHRAWVNALAVSRDGARLASAGHDGSVIVWDVPNRRQAAAFVAGADAVCVAFSPDGRRVAAGCQGTDLAARAVNTVKVWDLETGREALSLAGHASSIWCVAFSPDGARLASGSGDRTLKVWDAVTGKELHTLSGHNGDIYGLAFSPDGARLASASYDRTVKVWDVATGQEFLTLRGHPSVVWSVAFSPDGRRLATGSGDRAVKVWDATTGQEVFTLRGHGSGVRSVAFSPDGAWLASAGLDQTVRVWGAAADREVLTLRGHTYTVYSVAFSPDGRRLASAGRDGLVKLWDAATGQVVHTLTGHAADRSVTALAFRPDGAQLASASWDNTARLWDPTTGATTFVFPGHTHSLTGLAYSPDGTRLASGGADRTVKLWDAATGRVVREFPDHPSAVESLAVSPDGTRLAVACDNKPLKVWDVATGREAVTLRGAPSEAMSVAFSPDGTRLASGGWDQLVKVWDLATGEILRTLQGHSEGVLAVAYSPDGARLASGGMDGTVRVWDVTSGREILSLTGHTHGVRSVAFSADGARLSSGSYDGTVKVWDARPLTAATAVDHEAIGLLEFLFARPLCRADVLDELRNTPAIRPAARQRALALVDRYHEDTDPTAYYRAAWDVVRRPHLNAQQYQFALRQAAAAVRLDAGRVDYGIALGAAQYRAGQYAAAAATLNADDGRESGAATRLAFLAMTQFRLGRADQARATASRLKEVAPQSGHPEDRALVVEAQALIEGRAKGGTGSSH